MGRGVWERERLSGLGAVDSLKILKYRGLSHKVQKSDAKT